MIILFDRALKTARWAQQHPYASRLILLTLSTSGMILAFSTGTLLSSLNLPLSASSIYLAVGLACILSWQYPRNPTRDEFNRRLLTDIGLYTLAFFICFCCGSLLGAHSDYRRYPAQAGPYPNTTNMRAVSLSSSATNLAETTPNEKVLSRKQWRKELRRMLKQGQEYGRGVRYWKKIWQLLLFATLGLLTLLASYLLAALSCSLSCSGSAVAGTIVGVIALLGGIFGLGLIVYGIISLFRPRKGNPKNGPREEINS